MRWGQKNQHCSDGLVFKSAKYLRMVRLEKVSALAWLGSAATYLTTRRYCKVRRSVHPAASHCSSETPGKPDSQGVPGIENCRPLSLVRLGPDRLAGSPPKLQVPRVPRTSTFLLLGCSTSGSPAQAPLLRAASTSLSRPGTQRPRPCRHGLWLVLGDFCLETVAFAVWLASTLNLVSCR